MAKLLSPMTVWGLVRELKTAAEETRPLVVTGPLAEQLAKELSRGAAPGAVRVQARVEDASCLIRVLAGAPTEEDERELKAAKRAKVPVVVVQTGTEDFDVPYVLATDVVEVPPGAGFPIDEIARTLAARLGEKATNLGRRIPVLRDEVARHLVASFSTKAGWTAGAWFVPGGEFLPLTVQQVRLVLRIAHVYGHDVDPLRAPEVIGVVAGAYGWRGLARRLLGTRALPGWAVRGGVAYAATRAVGEAAIRRFSASEAPARA